MKNIDIGQFNEFVNKTLSSKSATLNANIFSTTKNAASSSPTITTSLVFSPPEQRTQPSQPKINPIPAVPNGSTNNASGAEIAKEVLFWDGSDWVARSLNELVEGGGGPSPDLPTLTIDLCVNGEPKQALIYGEIID